MESKKTFLNKRQKNTETIYLKRGKKKASIMKRFLDKKKNEKSIFG